MSRFSNCSHKVTIFSCSILYFFLCSRSICCSSINWQVRTTSVASWWRRFISSYKLRPPGGTFWFSLLCHPSTSLLVRKVHLKTLQLLIGNCELIIHCVSKYVISSRSGGAMSWTWSSWKVLVMYSAGRNGRAINRRQKLNVSFFHDTPSAFPDPCKQNQRNACKTGELVQLLMGLRLKYS